MSVLAYSYSPRIFTDSFCPTAVTIFEVFNFTTPCIDYNSVVCFDNHCSFVERIEKIGAGADDTRPTRIRLSNLTKN